MYESNKLLLYSCVNLTQPGQVYQRFSAGLNKLTTLHNSIIFYQFKFYLFMFLNLNSYSFRQDIRKKII